MNHNDLNKEARSVINDIEEAERLGRRIPLHKMNALEARKSFYEMRNALSPNPPEVEAFFDFKIPVTNGLIKARYYRGKNKDRSNILPVTIFFHGGGWVIGDLDTHDVVCRQISNEGNFDVVSVNYRKAPEYKFPFAINDSIEAINFVVKNSINLPIDTNKIALCGDSAGGNIATVCCINAKINFFPKIIFQALIYPSTHLGSNYNSRKKYDGLILSDPLMKWFQSKYLEKEKINDWRVAPILYKDLSKLNPSLIIVAGCDPLKDEGIAYGEALKKAGNITETKIFHGQIHGFLTMGARISDANKLIKLVCKKIDESFYSNF